MKQPISGRCFSNKGKERIIFILAILALVSLTGGCAHFTGPVVLIDYHRTGGIAGFNDHLVIYSNGNATVATKNTNTIQFTMTPAQIRNLETLFEHAMFSSLNSDYPAPSTGADYFTYTITYHGKTVTTEDTGVPEQLAPVISALDEIVSSHSR